MIGAERSPQAVYLDLERPSDVAKLADAELYLSRHVNTLVVLDEIQRRPDLFPVLRSLVDQDRRNGRFLVLGSASPELRRGSSESLAGRIVYLELGPFDAREVVKSSSDLDRLWLRGGFPRSYLQPTADAAFNWLNAFIATYLER
ncbi:MAG: AAA family ATPase, partial [Kiritimatiellota bacterium]|nr:AAA family ATPase [Kiritimatiellota bacterium]